MADKLTIKDLEREAERLYDAWRESRDYEDWKAYLEVKRELDALREENQQ